MTRVKRFALFFGGFSIGVFLLMFFLGGKNASCAYFPNARVLKNIRIKSPEISPEIQAKMNDYNLDSTNISGFFTNGKVIFDQSNIKINDTCKKYVIRREVRKDEFYLMQVKNCDSTAFVLDIAPYSFD